MKFKLVDNYKEAFKWYSTYASASAVSIIGAWTSSEAVQKAIDIKYVLLVVASIVVAGFLGRIVKQGE